LVERDWKCIGGEFMDLWKIPCEIMKEFCGLVSTFATKFCLISE
jgi:hypothetical protein